MKNTSKAVQFEQFGDPAEVLNVKEIPIAEPGRGEVRVRMIASPINPSDLLVIRGEYGRKPKLPATPGFEGVGVVEATGGGILGRLRRGKRVAVLNGQGGNWQQHVVLPARQVVPVPQYVPDEHAATFFVNPASALVMTRHVLKIQPGEWLLQTAAGSALGRMIIRLGKQHGFRTINIVRRREQADELRKLGADVVVSTDHESIEECVKAATAGAGALYAIDAVGGETGSAALRTLAPGGKMLVYGTLSEQPIVVHPRTLMANDLTLASFWLSNWVRTQGPMSMLGLFREIKKLMSEGVLTTEVGRTFAIDQIRDAVREAAKPGRNGKVMIRLDG
jgi:NADPH:quinone reductase-like Zn-dependent oxidoreductase